MAIDSLLTQIADDPSLPTPPGVAFSVLEKASRPECKIKEIAEIISYDSGLCGKLLKTVNSALFSFPHKVTTVDKALLALGYRAVRSLVLGLSLPALQAQCRLASKIKDYWKTSVAGAILARELALKRGQANAEDDLVAGLLRDLGIPILLQAAPDKYTPLLSVPSELFAERQCEIEEEALGINHAEVSAFLLRRWHLPDEITEAVRFHHHPKKARGLNPAVAERALVLYFATRIIQLQANTSQPAILRDVLKLAYDDFGMNEQEFLDFLDPINFKMQEFALLLNLDLGRCDSYGQVIARATDQLVKLTVEMSQDTVRVREERAEAERKTQQLRLKPAAPSTDQLRVGVANADANESTSAIRAPDLSGPGTRLVLPGAAPGHDTIDLPRGFLVPSEIGEHLGRLGQYEVIEVLGHGGMGVVLKAIDTQLDRPVAIKVLAPQLAASPTSRKRFAREARAAAAVNYEHVVAIHGISETAGLPYLVMEFVPGISMQDRLERDGSFPIGDILTIGMQIASGLEAAHAKGLVHRDVKPANILLVDGGCLAKITDFGLARTIDDSSITQNGVVMGTPNYMSPEQAAGKPFDHRVDLFSLGSVIYAMCTGHPPFDAENVMATLRSVCDDVPRAVQEMNPAIPDELVKLINWLHLKNPVKRCPTATAALDRMRQIRSALSAALAVGK